MNANKRRSIVLWGFLAGIFSAVPVLAQTPSPTALPTAGPTGIFTVYDGQSGLRRSDFTFSPPEVQNNQLDSKLMGRKMPYRVVLPVGYSDARNAAIRYPVIYLLHGLTGHFDNWTDRTKLAEYSTPYNAIIVTPEGENGWYTDSGKPNQNYESYVIKELIQEVDAKYRTAATRNKRAIAGLSMGGFGALKFGMKYPELFVVAGSFSGAVGASSYPNVDMLPQGLRNVLVSTFGEPGSAVHASNDLFKLVRDVSAEKMKTLPFLYIDCGTEDFLFQNNREFVSLLVEKKVPHEFRQLPGAHDWKYWDKQVQEFLRVANVRFSAN